MDTLRAIVYFLCIFTFFFGSNEAAHILRKRMVGGRNPTSDEAKQYVAFASGDNLCGGAVIDEKLVLTSAACVGIDKTTSKLAKRSKIVAGTTDLTKAKHNSALIIDVVKAYIPSSSNLNERPFVVDDVAVLELKENLNLRENSDKVQKLELPQLVDGEYPNYENTTVMAGGFGDKLLYRSQDDDGNDIFDGYSPFELQVGKSEIVGNEKCKMQGYGDNVKDSHICVKVIENLRHAGPCSGDKGSPVILDSKIVIGVLSTFDVSCDTDAYPAIYTRVSSYLGFIENVKSGNTADIVTYDEA